jgi:hypothetical protein
LASAVEGISATAVEGINKAGGILGMVKANIFLLPLVGRGAGVGDEDICLQELSKIPRYKENANTEKGNTSGAEYVQQALVKLFYCFCQYFLTLGVIPKHKFFKTRVFTQ